MANNPLPNIILILADDLGYGDLSCLNPESKIQTPRIDQLGREGMVFTDAHSTSAVCTPSRYSLLTGRYCWRSRLKKGVLWGYDQPLLEPERLTLPAMLHARGYTTACIGKWHLGLGWQFQGEAQTGPDADPAVDFGAALSAGPHTAGFDYSYIVPASLDMAPYVYIQNGKVVEVPQGKISESPRPAYYRGGWCAPGFSHETCLLELTKQAEAFIATHALVNPAKPFFLYFPLTSPHTPHMPRAPFQGKSQAGEYGDFVAETDWSVGRLMDTLQNLNLSENTLIIFTSDNGCHASPIQLEEKYNHRGNYIFRGQKSDAWDGGHRIPQIARYPAVIPAGSTCAQIACLSDWMATLAALCGLPLPANAAEDSINLMPYLLGETLHGETSQPLRESVVHHSLYGYFAIRTRQWKLIQCRGSGGWSLEESDAQPDLPPMQLYDLQNDIEEQVNLFAQRPDMVRELSAMLENIQVMGRSVVDGRYSF
jgi:arylsulfatase A-like enzyme